MAEAIAVILGVVALIGGVLWVATKHIRAVERERDDAVSRATVAEEAEAIEHEDTDRLRQALADAKTSARDASDRARSAEQARLEASDDREKAWRGHIEKLEQTIGTLTTHAAQREANLRNDVEAERVLAAKSLDSLTQMGTHLVTLSTEMAGLQRIGFRPPVKEADQPKDSAVVGMPSVEDVDRELMEDHPEMAARYD